MFVFSYDLKEIRLRCFKILREHSLRACELGDLQFLTTVSNTHYILGDCQLEVFKHISFVMTNVAHNVLTRIPFNFQFSAG